MHLRLSNKDRILIHLHDHINDQLSSKPLKIFSQEGISEATGLSQQSISYAVEGAKKDKIKGLVKETLVEKKLLHFSETSSFRNFYFLTPNGIMKAKELKKEIDEKTLKVWEKNEIREMKIGAVIEHLKKKFKGKIEINYTSVIRNLGMLQPLIEHNISVDLKMIIEPKTYVDRLEKKPEIIDLKNKKIPPMVKKHIDNLIEKVAGSLVEEDRESMIVELHKYLQTPIDKEWLPWWRYDKLIEFLKAELDSPTSELLLIIIDLFSYSKGFDKTFYSNLQKEMFENNKFKKGGIAWKLGKILENPNLTLWLRGRAFCVVQLKNENHEFLPPITDYFVRLITDPDFSWEPSSPGDSLWDSFVEDVFVAEKSKEEIFTKLMKWVRTKKREEIPEIVKQRIHIFCKYFKSGKSG